MKSKSELLELQNNKKHKKFQEYVKLMEEIINKKYPNELDFNECPYVQRFIYCGDINISYYTGIEKELIEAIKLTKAFKKISNELINNRYTYEFKSYVDFSWSRPNWEIILIIR